MAPTENCWMLRNCSLPKCYREAKQQFMMCNKPQQITFTVQKELLSSDKVSNMDFEIINERIKVEAITFHCMGKGRCMGVGGYVKPIISKCLLLATTFMG